MSKITAYGSLASTQSDDVLPVVDVHDTSMASSGTTKKITVAALLAGAGALTPVAVKTSGYTAAAGDLVPCDTTGGSFTVTLPAAPADKTQVGIKQVTQGAGNTVTVACAGSDVFNKAGGAAAGTLTLLAQGMLLQYRASGAIWYVLADDLPLSQLDARYAPPWITLPGSWYSGPWFTARAAGFASPAWILFDGDSVTNGVNPLNSGYLATGWPDQLRTKLLARGYSLYGDFYSSWAYNAAAGGVDPVSEGFPAYTGGSVSAEIGFGSSLIPSAANAWVQTVTTSAIPGLTATSLTGFDIVYYDWGSCTWAFQIDGGQGGSPTVSGATWSPGNGWYSVTNTGGGAAAGNVKKVTVTGLSAASHAIQWGQVSSGGNTIPLGFSFYTGSSSGVGFVRSAYSGRRAVDAATVAGSNSGYSGTQTSAPDDKCALWSGSGKANGTAQITPVPFGFPAQATLNFLAYGINDCANYINPASYGDALERKIIAYRRGVPNANVCLIAFCYPDVHNSDNNLAGNGVRYARWKRVMAEVAAAYGCAYVDIDAKWGGTPVAQGFMQSGNVHPLLAGAQDIASVVSTIV